MSEGGTSGYGGAPGRAKGVTVEKLYRNGCRAASA